MGPFEEALCGGGAVWAPEHEVVQDGENGEPLLAELASAVVMESELAIATFDGGA